MTDPAAPEAVPPRERPPRTGLAKYLLPEAWLGRIALAWVLGLVVILVLTAIRGGGQVPVGFWTLVAVLAAFGISDYRRDRRPPPT